MDTLTPQSVLADRYELLERIGRGATATVWRSRDRVLERLVAVKVLHASLAADPAACGRFINEAREAARLADPTVVAVFDTVVEDGTWAVVEELVDGDTLAVLLRREGSLAPDRTVAVTNAVLEALEHAYAQGTTHGDLKPENVFVWSDGRVKVADFGMRAPRAPTEATETTAETEAGSDVRAAGALTYEMLTGRRPTSRTPPAPRALRSSVPKDLDTVVMRALAPLRVDRYASAHDMRAALQRIRPPSEPAAKDDPGGGEHAHEGAGSVFRSWMHIPIVLVLAAAALIAGGLALGRLQVGGPLGVRLAGVGETTSASPAEKRSRGPGAVSYPITSARAVDPFGDGHEDDESAALAIDRGNTPTFWKTEDYFDGSLGKAGVGLLLDLGRTRTITKFRLATPYPGFRFQVRTGNDPDKLPRSRGPEFRADRVVREDLPDATGRYVMIWIVSVANAPDGTHRAAVSDVELLGPNG